MSVASLAEKNIKKKKLCKTSLKGKVKVFLFVWLCFFVESIPQHPPPPLFFPPVGGTARFTRLEKTSLRESLHKQASHKVNIQKGVTVCLVLFIFPSVKTKTKTTTTTKKKNIYIYIYIYSPPPSVGGRAKLDRNLGQLK